MKRNNFFKILYGLFLLILVACQAQVATTQIVDELAPTAKVESDLTTMSSKIFQIPMQVTYSSDWVGNSDKEWLTLESRKVNLFIDFLIVDAVTLREKNDPPTYIPFPDDFAGYLASTPFWSEVTPATAIKLDGVDAIQMDALGESLESTTNRVSFLIFENAPFKEFLASSTQKFRFIYLNNVNGKKLLIVIGSNVPLEGEKPALSAEEFEAYLPKVQEVLDTVVFTQP